MRSMFTYLSWIALVCSCGAQPEARGPLHDDTSAAQPDARGWSARDGGNDEQRETGPANALDGGDSEQTGQLKEPSDREDRDQLADARVVRLPPLTHQDGAVATADAASSPSEPDAPTVPSEGPSCAACPVAEEVDLCAQLARRAGLSLRQDVDVSWGRLLCETVDLTRFVRAPAQPYRALMASSYDRAAKTPGNEGWFANNDRGFYLRDQGDEHVLMEAEGPGVITRLWSPTPSGSIRIYIDDRDVPAIEAPMADLLSGNYQAPWGEPFVFVAAEGHSAYLPIPYGRYARVATTTSESLYYQVDYREYDPATRVESFTAEGLRALAPLASEVDALLDDPSGLLRGLALEQRVLVLDAATPAETVAIGPAIIRELTITGFEPSEAYLRSTRVILSVDGERTVDAPLGDLFGGGPGHVALHSLAASKSEDTLTLRWPMPVIGELTVRLEGNPEALGALTVALRYTRGAPAEPRLFHALWTGAQTFRTERPVDWTLLHAMGTGWYVGTVLNVANPSVVWWGEGDEKIYVDGEAFPSHFGTGTEDYFGYGWCSNELFTRPWIGQSRADGPGNWGRSSLYRWHVGDAIPFARALRFDLEVQHWISGVLGVDLTEDAVSYWYAAPGATVAQPMLTHDAFVAPPLESMAPLLPGGVSTCRL